jgi:3'(2'), 5'-bisphosphate nucleotidase
MININKLCDLAIEAAHIASRVILEYYLINDQFEFKNDCSPLTRADQSSDQAITCVLSKSGLPIVSEEGGDLLISERSYWLVDPLDGTKDFLAGNDEFTVNVAFVNEGRPVLGVILAPALNELYVGIAGKGSWSEKFGRRLNCKPVEKSSSCRMAVSRFHDHPDVEFFAKTNKIKDRVAIGSALKYGRLSNAEVDIFPRLVGSSEWDTAAGQVILEGAGGSVLDWSTGQSLEYGKPKRRNPRLLAMRSPYSYHDFHLKKYESEIT